MSRFNSNNNASDPSFLEPRVTSLESNQATNLPLYGVEHLKYSDRRTRLPYTAKAYQLIEDWVDITDWAGVGAVATTLAGKPAIKWGAAANGTGEVTKTFGPVLNVYPYLAFKALIDANFSYLRVDFSQDNTFASFYRWELTGLPVGENDILLNKTTVTATVGTPSWSNIGYVRLQLKATTGGQSYITIDQLDNYQMDAMVTIWFDDGHHSVYDAAKPKMDTYGFRGVNAIIGDFVNNQFYITTKQMKDMIAAGWENTNHTYQHKQLGTITAPEIEIQMQKGLEYCLAQGFGKGSYYFVNPASSTSTTSDQISRKYATVRRRLENYNYAPIVDYFELRSKQPLYNHTQADINGWIDNAVNGGLWLILLYHTIYPDVNVGTDPLRLGQTIFDGTMDYLNTKQTAGSLKVVTCSEAMMKM